MIPAQPTFELDLDPASPPPEPWTLDGGVYWMNCTYLNVREVARAMNALSARFVTITAYQLPGAEGIRLEYHWDLNGRLLGFRFKLEPNSDGVPSIESIYDLCEAVDWIERETHEGFAVDFTGREYEPLLLRQGDTPGVNLREIPDPGQPAPASQGPKEVTK